MHYTFGEAQAFATEKCERNGTGERTKVYTLAEIAVLAHAHPSTVWRHRRELGARKLFGRWKVSAQAWERYLRRGQTETVKPFRLHPDVDRLAGQFVDDMERARRWATRRRG